MKEPTFNPRTMDIFTKKGREKFDQYMKEKKLYEKGLPKAKAKPPARKPKRA
jgi:hypothetical protein